MATAPIVAHRGSVSERERHQGGQAEVGERRRQLHQDANARVGPVGGQAKTGLDRGQHAPHVGHDGPKRHGAGGGLAVQRAQTVRRDVVDPTDEHVDVLPHPVRRQQDEPDQDPDGQARREDGDLALAERPRGCVLGGLVRRDHGQASWYASQDPRPFPLRSCTAERCCGPLRRCCCRAVQPGIAWLVAFKPVSMPLALPLAIRSWRGLCGARCFVSDSPALLVRLVDDRSETCGTTTLFSMPSRLGHR